MDPKRVPWLVLACLLVATSGCGDDEARVSFHGERFAGTNEKPSYRVQYTDGERTRLITPEQLAATLVGPFDTPNHGELWIDVAVLNEEGAALAEGSVVLDLRKDWRWGIGLTIADRSPEENCLGCIGSASFDLSENSPYPDGHKLYVVWLGTSISNPVVY